MGNEIEKPRTRLRRIAAAGVLAAHVAFAQTTPAPEPPPGKLTTIYGFTLFGPTGSRPDGGLVLGVDGNFYGTTTAGGTPCGCGTIFKVTPDGNLTTLYAFTGGVAGGATPRGAMVQDSQGNLYGTTAGSTSFNPSAFRITPAGVFTSFGVLPGNNPNGLVVGRDGNLYGTTSNGGPAQYGTFFRITPAGVVTLLHAFGGSGADYAPSALIEGSDGAFYGANRVAILSITPAGAVSVLYKPEVNVNGPSNIFDGLNPPASGLVLAGDGNFYGAADDGVFQVTPTGSFKRLFRYAEVGLSGSSNTSVIHNNRTALILGGDGNLYGSNGQDGNCNDCGSVYQVTTGGAFKLIYKFAGGGLEGGIPSMLTQGPDGLYGTTMTLGPGKPGGGTVFKVAFSSGGGSTTPPPPPVVSAAPPGPIQAIDPNVAPDPDAVPADPTPDLRGLLLGTAPWSDRSYQVFANYSRQAKGLAADGVTPLILLCSVPMADGAAGSMVTFTITDENGRAATTDQIGTLGCIYSPGCDRSGGTSYDVQPQPLSDPTKYAAFVRLTAPLDFVRPGSADGSLKERSITVTATLPSAPGAAPRQSKMVISLARPPLVLLHGIWSDEGTWGWKCDSGSAGPDCLDDRFVVWPEDYQATNADYFVVNLGLDPVKGKNEPRAGIETALGILRAKGFAATQADLVGHSMGGLLARLYAGEYTRSFIQDVPVFDLQVHYYRDDNLRAGDMHKLITLDTPHFGSEMTNELLDANGVITNLGVGVNLLGCVICGAVSDLSPGSPPLSNMPVAKVPSHAIYGVGGNQALADVDQALAGQPPESAFGAVLFILDKATQSEVACLFGDLRHDTIVTATSQIGGMPSVTATSPFDAQPSLSNPWWWAIHNTVTKDSRISRRVIELLNASARSELFSQFPAGRGTAPIGTPCFGR